MDKGLSEKMLGIAEKSPFPIQIKHDNGRETIIIGFNQQTGKYGISFTKDGENKDMKIGVSKEDMISYMSDPAFEADLSRISREIEEKEKAYAALRKKLMTELDEMELPEKDKETVKKAIEYLTVLPEYTETVPRLGLGSQRDGDYILNEYTRVGNEYDRKQAIALQFISRMTGPSGSTTNYKKMELKDLAKRLKSREEPEAKKEEKKEEKEAQPEKEKEE